MTDEVRQALEAARGLCLDCVRECGERILDQTAVLEIAETADELLAQLREILDPPDVN